MSSVIKEIDNLLLQVYDPDKTPMPSNTPMCLDTENTPTIQGGNIPKAPPCDSKEDNTVKYFEADLSKNRLYQKRMRRKESEKQKKNN